MRIIRVTSVLLAVSGLAYFTFIISCVVWIAANGKAGLIGVGMQNRINFDLLVAIGLMVAGHWLFSLWRVYVRR